MSNLPRQLSQSHDVAAKVAQILQTRTTLALARFNERAQQAREQIAGLNELGMEAIYEFEVKDMPVTVAVDPTGHSIHETGPTEWRAKIAKIPVLAH